ncbi:hypothetical protein DRW03_21035 [Corallococcus sp. H22C18031201]|uniref:hypothetical protein n=1 Tax=Citreicoccus inhibens TaxID=2849499 RepID=UPI000E72DB64|nr:hypothetical protein [Citreicoccus inhibens]MBU8895822.1 hypothetical protein [Citreicoccus inhibens]RJS20286.1 hypothetical protein DRW03_21035 [Corallococcus sp. H22C18031201]
MSRVRTSMFVVLAVGAVGIGCGDGNHLPRITVGPRLSLAGVSEGGVRVTEGTTVQLQLEVNDEDGDTLEFNWRQEPETPAGQFSDPHARAPTWVVPPQNADHPETPLFIYVNVQDGNGGGLLGRTAPIYVSKG